MATDSLQDVLIQLNNVKDNDPGLAEAVDLQKDLIAAGLAVNVHPVVAPQYDANTVRARFAQALPLVRTQELALDWEEFGDLYREVCRIATQHRPDLSEQFKSLVADLEEDAEKVRALTETFLDEGSLMATVEGYQTPGEYGGDQRELLNFVLIHTLHPFLRAYADALIPALAETMGSNWDQEWQRGNCPICGGEPDFAFIDEDTGHRHLVCSRCDSHWLYPRVKCPFCGNAEPNELFYFPSTDDAYRVYVCQNCLRYLKAIDRRRVARRVFFSVERLASVSLDLAAREKGYR